MNQILSNQIDNKKREIVKFSNEFFSFDISELNGNEQNYLRYILTQNIKKFDFIELRKNKIYLNKDTNKIEKFNDESIKKISKAILIYEDKKNFISFPFFSYIKLNKRERIIEYKINDFVSRILIENLNNNFTNYFLNSFTDLKNKYSKIIFERLMKFQNGTKNAVFKINEFKKILGISEIENKRIKERIIDVIIPELETIFINLKWEFIRQSESKYSQINLIKFTWDDIYEEHKTELSKNSKKNLELKEIRNENSFESAFQYDANDNDYISNNNAEEVDLESIMAEWEGEK